VTVDEENGTLKISLTNVAVVDQLTFPNPGGINLGASGIPATVSFSVTYQKSGAARHVRPTSADPVSPFTWAGEMWMATNSGTFSLAYNDGSFSAQGSFSSAGNFGELGRERNGSFVRREDRDEGAKAAAVLRLPGQTSTGLAGGQLSAVAAQPANSPKFRGKVPVEYFFH
jgi:hypothetical protein